MTSNPRQQFLSFPVVIGEGSHPFPFRTRKLSSLPPMVLHAKVCGRVGHCRDYYRKKARCFIQHRAFSCYREKEEGEGRRRRKKREEKGKKGKGKGRKR